MSKDIKENIVVIIFYEDPQGNTAVTSIIPILEGYSEFGGFQVNIEYELNNEVKNLFNKHFGGFVETIATPIACLGSQIVRGTEYAILCEFSPVINYGNDDRDVKIVFINDMDEDFSMINIL